MTSSSKVTFLNAGFSTEGEIEQVLLVGPMAPQTNRRIPVASVTYNNFLLFSRYSKDFFLMVRR